MQKIIFSLFIVFLLPVPAFAATVVLDGPAMPPSVQDTFTVGVSLTTGPETINAIEGSVQIPFNLSVSEIRLSGSIVPLWISPPKETTPGVVSFAGVLPGGFHGTAAAGQGNLFTLVLNAKKEGAGAVSFGPDTAVYKDDGKGTSETPASSSLVLTVKPFSGTKNTAVLTTDTTPPEVFTPIVTSAVPFGAQGSALVFTAQDKDTGIAGYEIARSYSSHSASADLSWGPVLSPYIFMAGDDTHYLYVRATDNAGNTRIAIVPPQKFSVIVFFSEWWLILVLIAALVILSRYFARR